MFTMILIRDFSMTNVYYTYSGSKLMVISIDSCSNEELQATLFSGTANTQECESMNESVSEACVRSLSARLHLRRIQFLIALGVPS